MDMRTLNDGDLPALERLLAPAETTSFFLLGNARQHGIDDRGGPLNGCWVGAFEGGALVGVVAYFRGFGSIQPACDGLESRLIPELLERIEKPRVVVGTGDRVAATLAHLPWPVAHHQRDRLLVLRWADYRPLRLPGVRAVLEHEADVAAAAIGAMHGEVGLPTDPAANLAAARRLVAKGHIRALWEREDLRAISMEGAATGRLVHVGATWCAPATRRRGYAGACVSDVLDRARAEGRASEGGVLFTGRENVPALRLYERLGFRQEADWELAFLA